MADDLSALENMVYSGRAFVIGMTPAGNEFVGYSLTGRSSGSRERELQSGWDTQVIRTKATDEEKMRKDPKANAALLLYPAIVPVHNAIIVSNGIQTELIYSVLNSGSSVQNIIASSHPDTQPYIRQALGKPSFRYDSKNDMWIDITSYEPDSPIYTPRISGLVIGDKATMHIVRRGSNRRRDIGMHSFNLEPGRGKLITTYKGGNEDPYPLSFVGEPLDVTIESQDAHGIVLSIYKAIEGGSEPGENYRVAAAVMMHDRKNNEMNVSVKNRTEEGS